MTIKPMYGYYEFNTTNTNPEPPMPTVSNPLKVLKEAKQIAIKHGCFVVEKADPKGTRYLVYRRLYDRNECVGTRFSVTSLHKLVCKVTNYH